MISAIDFLSEKSFSAIGPLPPSVAIISIGAPGEPAPGNLAGCANVLRLEFYDCAPSDLADVDVPCGHFFTAQQSQVTAAFIRQLHNKPKNYILVVHCHYGESRSAALSLAAYAMTQAYFPRFSATAGANGWVLHTMEKALGIAIPKALSVVEPDCKPRWQQQHLNLA